jgi:hypothetical protein
MRAYWILPNRKQGDELLVSDGFKTSPLREVLDPTLRPEGFSHGVPTEILERCDPGSLSEILFAQTFPRWNGDQRLVSISTTAGSDSSGRVVHIGLLLFLDAGERPTFEVPCAGLSSEDAKHATVLLARMTKDAHDDPWVQSVRDLLESSPDLGPATNVELKRSVARFSSLYTLGAGGPRRKGGMGWRAAAVVIVIAAAISVASVVLHGARCATAPGTVGEPSADVGQLSPRTSHARREW